MKKVNVNTGKKEKIEIVRKRKVNVKMIKGSKRDGRGK